MLSPFIVLESQVLHDPCEPLWIQLDKSYHIKVERIQTTYHQLEMIIMRDGQYDLRVRRIQILQNFNNCSLIGYALYSPSIKEPQRQD